GERSRCVRFAAGWPPAKASCATWDCPTRPSVPPWLTPTNIAPAVVPQRVLSTAQPLPRGHRRSRLPFQEQAALARRHADGYNDYAWFAALDANGVYFVTRIKDNTDYGVLERRPVSSLRLNRGRRMTSSYSE